MTIQVFEHQVLKIGEQTGFDEAVWEALIRFNDRHGQRYFTVIHKGVRFGHYVGVIQIGRLTIEVLPKADAAASGDKNHWQSVLIAMLKSCRLLKIETLSNARLRLQQHFILDLYFELFIEAVEKLITAFDKAKTYFESKERVSTKKMMTISGLAEAETVIFLKILKEK